MAGIGRIKSADTYVKEFVRYDMSAKYTLNEHLSFYLTGVNLTSTADIRRLSGTNKHSNYDVYGAMYDLGVQVNF